MSYNVQFNSCYKNIILILCLTSCLTGCLRKDYSNETEFSTLETIDVSNNVINKTDETIKYNYNLQSNKELPDIEGFNKDEYGNYIISEEDIKEDRLPLNDDGKVDYILYYDENGNILNPMPEYYERFPDIFIKNGG